MTMTPEERATQDVEAILTQMKELRSEVHELDEKRREKITELQALTDEYERKFAEFRALGEKFDKLGDRTERAIDQHWGLRHEETN